MNWIKVSIRAEWKACDEISEMLIAIGAGGVEIEDPLDMVLTPEQTDASEIMPAKCGTSKVTPVGANAPEIIPARANIDPVAEADSDSDACSDSGVADNPAYITIKAYFAENVYNPDLVHTIREKMESITRQINAGEWSFDSARVDERDWANEWKKHFRPFHITSSIVIKPSWDDYRVQAEEKVVELDPGMAFGTGKHETTRMCACLVEKYMEAGSMVADIGCGSGILAIIADILGAGHVDAVDIDQTAVTVAMENVEKNGAKGRIIVKKGGIEELPGKYDFITANIVADVLIELSGKLPLYLEKEGKVAVSGILKDREQEVIQAFENNGFTIAERLAENDWTAVLFLKNHF